MIGLPLATAVFLPFAMAIIATILTWRSVQNRTLFFVVTLFTFFGLQEIAYGPISHLLGSPGTTAEDVISTSTKVRFMADLVAALVGGFVAWRLYVRFTAVGK